ncbi:MAG: amidohydrolase family protein [Rhodobacteraceae bacterium]|nr:amidohydrolase family protein [Paracoccaceae bacterium]MCF8515540.1 amidohydrolase family protein [Paracoccaceae bacterium]MCF8519785.1 amidohydrolase family protein [Paracoccaceae bacterium]
MLAPSPHYPVREDWLALAQEEVLAPAQVIFDCHHHLWDRPEGRYQTEAFLQDVGSGHAVRASLYIQCRTGYLTKGPEALRPLGEIETILRWGQSAPLFPVGMVGCADLQLGERIAPVLEAMATAANGRLRGIRNATAWHPDPAVRSNSRPAPAGLLRSDAFAKGARVLAAHRLPLDIWAYQTQLDEVYDLARAVPELAVIIDHCGGPLGVGPHRRDDAENFANWRAGLARLAALPNTKIKIGGFGLSVTGYDYATRALPPHSKVLAADWRAWVNTCLDLFGPKRAMFESNFPVDKGQFSYRTLWNAFKRLAAELTEQERADLFWRSAAQSYDLDPHIFTT